MVKPNASATLYNRWRNPQTGKDEYRPVYLEAVHWESREGANVASSGLANADVLLMIVWLNVHAEGRAYVRPKEYARLSQENIDKHWTISKGIDRVVKGKVDGAAVITDIKQITNNYDDCFAISTADTMDFGPRYAWHIEAGGK